MSTPQDGSSPLPPVPQYGEYAAGEPAQPAPQQAPAYAPQFAQQPYPHQPYAQQPTPQQPYYGQPPYSAQAGAQFAQPYGAAPYYGGKRPVRTADAIISIVLMVLGLAGVGIAIGTAVSGLDSFMQGGYDAAGLGSYEQTGAHGVTQAFIIASHLILFLVTVPLTALLIVKRKISFWLPLSTGLLAAILFWVALLVFMYSDPAMSEAILQQPTY